MDLKQNRVPRDHLSLRREISTAAHCFLRYFFYRRGAPMQMPRLLSRSAAIGGTSYPRESLIYWLQNRHVWPWKEPYKSRTLDTDRLAPKRPTWSFHLDSIDFVPRYYRKRGNV